MSFVWYHVLTLSSEETVSSVPSERQGGKEKDCEGYGAGVLGMALGLEPACSLTDPDFRDLASAHVSLPEARGCCSECVFVG